MQIATNPQTGERLQWNGSAWVPMSEGAPVGRLPVLGPPPKPEKPSIPSGYRETPGGLEPIPGGPADPYAKPQQNDPPSGYRWSQNGSLEAIPGGPADKANANSDPKLVDAERTAAFLATRVAGGIKDIGAATELDPSAVKPGVAASVAGALPIIGSWARRSLNDPERQRVEAAQYDVLDAALTLGTGAAYSKEQIDAYRESYFPQIGDDEATITDKRNRLVRLLEAAKLKAGNAAPQIDEALAAIVAQTGGAKPEGGAATDDADIPTLVGASRATRAHNAAEEAKRRAMIEGRLADSGAGTAFVGGVGDTLTFGFGDEIDAGLNAFGDSIRGQGSVSDLYNRYLAVNRGVNEGLQEQNGGTYLAGQLVGGAAVPFGSGAKSLSQLAKVGAAQGATYGFGSGESALGRVGGAALGGVAGGAIGAGVGAASKPVANAVTRFSGASRAEQQAEAAAARQVIDAGERRGVPIRQPDARPSLRNQYAAAEATEGGGPIIRQAINSDAEMVRADARSLAPNGRARDVGGLGEIVQGAINRHGERTRQAAKSEYTAVEQLAPNHVGDATPVVGAIRAQVAKLEAGGSNATKAEREFLTGIADDLEKSGLSVQSLQAQRESARKRMMAAGIDHSAAEARLDEVMKVAGDALDQSLDINPKAQAALRRANKIWAERADFRRSVRDTFLGKKGDVTIETAGQRLEKMFDRGGDSRKFQRVWSQMTESERNDVLASVIEGSGSRGRNEFSLAQLAKSIETMNPRTMVKAFGADGAKALRDIKTIAGAKADAMSGLNNSKSGVVQTHNGLNFRTLLFGGLGASVGDVTGMVGGAAASKMFGRFSGRRAARMLLNNDFRKWLKTVPPTSNAASINRSVARLNAIAAKSPVMAADAQALQQFLRDALAAPVTKAAAQGEQADDSGQE